MELPKSNSPKGDSQRNKLIAIGGLTATGKTALAIKVAKRFDCEIISADSRQIYKYLNIGTAKPKIEKKLRDGISIIRGVPHHLIDILDPADQFDLAKFKKLAIEKIEKISQKNKTPIIAGGTGLYIDSVLKNYSLQGGNIDHKNRSRLQNSDVQTLCSILDQISPDSLASMTPSDQKNKHRLIRAIERAKKGQPRSDQEPRNFKSLYLVKTKEIEILTKEINDRVDKMFQKGLLKENIALRKKGYSTDLTSMKTIGYQEFDDYFADKIDMDEVKKLIKIHTRQYAKRQITWFKRNPEAVWFENDADAMHEIEKFLKQ